MNSTDRSFGSDGESEVRTESTVLQSLFRTELANGIDESEVFHILGNDRRREIICTLVEENDGLSVSDLAKQIARKEEDEDLESSKNLYKSVYVSLQQTHLPKLAEKEIIVYDKDPQRVEPGTTFSQIQPYLRGRTRLDTTVRLVVPLLLSGLGLLFALGLTMRIPVVESVGTAAVGGIFFLLIVVLVVSQTIR